MLNLMYGSHSNNYYGIKNIKPVILCQSEYDFSSVLKLSIFSHWIFTIEHSKCYWILKALFRMKSATRSKERKKFSILVRGSEKSCRKELLFIWKEFSNIQQSQNFQESDKSGSGILLWLVLNFFKWTRFYTINWNSEICWICWI
jgi:hypothetical protein